MSATENQVPQRDKARDKKYLTIAAAFAVFGVIFELFFNNNADPSAFVSIVELIVVFGITLSLGTIPPARL